MPQLPAVFGAKMPTRQDEDQRILRLEFRELAALSRLVGQLIIRKRRPYDNIATHRLTSLRPLPLKHEPKKQKRL
jgi:hypothetical protein